MSVCPSKVHPATLVNRPQAEIFQNLVLRVLRIPGIGPVELSQHYAM